MNENILNKKNYFNQISNKIKKNLKIIIISFVFIFLIFISFQIISFYNINKIKNSSVSFFDTKILNDQNLIQENILKLSKENNFYGILSQLELINLNLKNNKFDNAISLYKIILSDKNLENIYISAIASRASYQFIDISFNDLSKNYTDVIIYFLSNIDNNLVSYEGIKLELNYLLKIIEVEKNKIEYVNYNEVIDLYNVIMNSNVASSNLKDRINKIHEFYTYK